MWCAGVAASALVSIMQHGERLAAVVALRAFHNEQAASHVGQVPPSPFSRTLPVDVHEPAETRPKPLWEAIQLAGEHLRLANAGLLNREPSEIFFSRVSEVVEVLCRCAAACWRAGGQRG